MTFKQLTDQGYTILSDEQYRKVFEHKLDPNKADAIKTPEDLDFAANFEEVDEYDAMEPKDTLYSLYLSDSMIIDYCPWNEFVEDIKKIKP